MYEKRRNTAPLLVPLLKARALRPHCTPIIRGGLTVCVLLFLRLSMVEPPLIVCIQREELKKSWEPLKISSLPACSVRKLFIISAQADCESSLPACSVRKWFIVSAKADCESSLAACSVRKWFIVSAKADCESSLAACSVRKWFIISAKADCESLFRGFYTTINLGNTNIQT